MRPTRAEILLDAIGHNFSVVRSAARGCKVLAVVKADAYGHGVVPVAQRLQAEGVDGFGVALAEEGIELREAGIDRASEFRFASSAIFFASFDSHHRFASPGS